MLRLENGNTFVYQWDTEQYVSCEGCDTVQFSNDYAQEAIVVIPKNNLAKIPNSLLMFPKTIMAYGWSGTASEGYTQVSLQIRVVPRSRPSDWVFTPEDQLDLEKILKEIGDLSQLKTTDKSDLVSAINEIYDAMSSGGQIAYKIGYGLKLDVETNTLSVDATNSVEQDNTLPITSAGVYVTVGNINALLGTI